MNASNVMRYSVISQNLTQWILCGCDLLKTSAWLLRDIACVVADACHALLAFQSILSRTRATFADDILNIISNTFNFVFILDSVYKPGIEHTVMKMTR